MIVVRRPIASEIFPPMKAPTAAAKTSRPMTMPSCKSESPSSACIGPSAVGHPGVVSNSRPPRQATIEMRPIRLRCGPGVSGAWTPMLVECVIGGLLRLQPLVVPQPSPLQVYMSASRGFLADGAGKVKAMGDGGQGGVAVCAACWRMVKGRAEPVKGRVRVGRGAFEADRWLRRACWHQPSLSLSGRLAATRRSTVRTETPSCRRPRLVTVAARHPASCGSGSESSTHVAGRHNLTQFLDRGWCRRLD